MSSRVLLLFLLSAGLCPTLHTLELDKDMVEKIEKTTTFVSSNIQPKLTAMLDSKQKYEENIGKLMSRFSKGSPEASKRAGQALSAFLKSVGMLAKAASTIAALAPYLNFILAFIPQQDEPHIVLMKQQFVEVNRKLDSIGLKVSLLLTEVQWACYASEYSGAETDIENSWDKFSEFMTSKFTQKEDKVKMAQAFIEFYENTATEGSVASFYRYLTQEGPSLRLNLFTLLADKFKGDITAVLEYSHHFSTVMLRGLQLQLYYHIMKGYNKGEAKAMEFAQKYNEVLRAQQKALLYCIQNYQKWIKEDVQDVGEKSAWQDSKDLALNIKQVLENKYFWLNWAVVVYGKDETGHTSAGRYIEVPTRDRIVILFNREKGAQVEESQRDKVKQYFLRKSFSGNSHLYGLMVNRLCHNHISADAMKKELEPIVAEVHAGPKDGKFYQTEGSGSEKHRCTHTADYTVFLEPEAPSPPPCSSNPCLNGECLVIKETSGEFCKCHKNFYGDKCELSVLDELDWEQHKQKISSILSQPVPDLTSSMLRLTALIEHNAVPDQC